MGNEKAYTRPTDFMPRVRLTLEYAGTRYSGWQIQKNAKTVQGELNAAIRQVVGRMPFETYGSGRTDAGVHALGQVAHLDSGTNLPPATLVARINDALPPDINVLGAERVSPRFHARHSAVARSYIYQIARRRTAFAKPFVWWVKDSLDLTRMRAAADLLTGFSDFRAFTDDDPGQKSTTVLVENIAIAEDGDLVLLGVAGSHFLWKMVRRITGVLVEVGRGGLAPGDVRGLLNDDSDLPARLTAPASGLFLEQVYYTQPQSYPPLSAPLFRLSGFTQVPDGAQK
jgi:tRNA pseudouridine38-40 synthase